MIAASMTIPTAKANPAKLITLIDFPRIDINTKVPIIVRGIVVIITAVTRTEFKKSKRT